ncbi:hypothetical protein G9C98_002775 [Cotesia typhae]|uniref:Glycosyl hydrolase family 13 catalytic domain-containing protein n=1 Tax=Cotesia typhae TaxID=2053667 RepID=A0A8J5R7Q6_9HYME|nr:hypothetical protein G9C98_002775 [Cotesia typhae]
MDKLNLDSTPGELLKPRLIIQDESDCPLLTPSSSVTQDETPSSEQSSLFINQLINDNKDIVIQSGDVTSVPAVLSSLNSESGIKAFMNSVVNSNNNKMNDESSSRDPMVESSSNSTCSEQSLNKEPVCTQLLTQLNTAYQHLAPDAQAIFCSQENGGKPSLVGGNAIQLVMPKTPKDYEFTRWNWVRIRQVCFWLMICLLSVSTTFVIRGIVLMPRSSRINYLKSLGVKAVRLNSIFPSDHYPEHYSSIESLTSIDENLGHAADFDELLQNLHRSGIKLILDVPVRYIPVPETLKQKREAENSTGSKITPNFQRYVAGLDNQVNVIHQVTAALKFWRSKNIDGFYLKDLEHHVNNNSNIVDVLSLWKDLMEGDRILMCHWKVLEAVKSEDVKKALIQSMSLVDFILNFGNGTLELKKQVNQVISSRIFQGLNDEEVQSRPWIHWSTGGVDRRLIDGLAIKNASSSNIFAGDSNMELLKSMIRLRESTAPIYSDTAKRHEQFGVNCEIKYARDELVIIERWYTRQNTYIYLGNFGNTTHKKDFSSFFYEGTIVVGPVKKINQTIHFKEFEIAPGEAFVIKLEK